MRKCSEIGNKIFNSKCENQDFVKNKIAIHKEIFKQLFFNLRDIDIDNINNQFWLKKIESQLNKQKNKKEMDDISPSVGREFNKILSESNECYYWRIINLFTNDYCNPNLHFDDIEKDLVSNELYLYSFCLNLCIWFDETLCKNLYENKIDMMYGWGCNKYIKKFESWEIPPTKDAVLIKLLANHFHKILKTIMIICEFCMYDIKEEKEKNWYFIIKSNEGILIDEIKSKEIKFDLIQKLIDFKKCEHNPLNAYKHLFAILKDPYTFIVMEILIEQKQTNTLILQC